MLYSRDVISAVPLAMKAHSSSPALLKAAVNLLTALSSDGKSVCGVADHSDSCDIIMVCDADTVGFLCWKRDVPKVIVFILFSHDGID